MLFCFFSKRYMKYRENPDYGREQASLCLHSHPDLSSAMSDCCPGRHNDENPPPKNDKFNCCHLVCGIRSSSCFSLDVSTLVRLCVPPQSVHSRTGSVIWGWVTNLLWIRIVFWHTSSHLTLYVSVILN